MQLGIGVYVKNSAEAVPFYMQVFGLELGYHVKNADGSYFHSELSRHGEPFLSVVESRDHLPHNNIVNLGVTLPDKSAVLHAFALLKDGGRVIMEPGPLPWSPFACEVVDRYGLWWFLSMPMQSVSDDFSPDTFDYPVSQVDTAQ